MGREKHQCIMPVVFPAISINHPVYFSTVIFQILQEWEGRHKTRSGGDRDGHSCGCPGLSLPGVPNPQADSVWMGVPKEDSQENYSILVPSLTSQDGWHSSPQRALMPWLCKFSVAVWQGILSKCFPVNQEGCVNWHQAWQLTERTLKASHNFSFHQIF